MRVLCRHGHFSFYPRISSDLAKFSQMFGFTLKREEDYFTFESLANAPKYSLAGKSYLNLPAVKTFEGNPWDVMRENGFVYHLGTKLLVPKLQMVSVISLSLVGFYYISNGALIQPGCRTETGFQILYYSGEFYQDRFYLRVLEYGNE